MTAIITISGTPLQYSCLENPMDGGAWCAAVHGVAKSRSMAALSWRVMPPQPLLKCLWPPFCRHCTVPLAGPFSCDAFVIHIFKRFIDVIDLYLSAQGLCCGTWAPHCGSFSRCRARASWLWGTWDPPRAGSKPVSPSLAGRFLFKTLDI